MNRPECPIDLLYVACGRSVTAIDRHAGGRVWSTVVGGIFGHAITMIHAAGGRVYVLRSPRVYCLDRSTGAILWQQDADGGGWFGVLTIDDATPVASAAQQAAIRELRDSRDDFHSMS
jgi:outer membrane protein assembly factor BamB